MTAVHLHPWHKRGQAFSHLALIEAAGRIIVAERLKEYV
jgi:hypothetical protein